MASRTCFSRRDSSLGTDTSWDLFAFLFSQKALGLQHARGEIGYHRGEVTKSFRTHAKRTFRALCGHFCGAGWPTTSGKCAETVPARIRREPWCSLPRRCCDTSLYNDAVKCVTPRASRSARNALRGFRVIRAAHTNVNPRSTHLQDGDELALQSIVRFAMDELTVRLHARLDRNVHSCVMGDGVRGDHREGFHQLGAILLCGHEQVQEFLHRQAANEARCSVLPPRCSRMKSSSFPHPYRGHC